MAMCVIDLFKFVDITEQDREWLAKALLSGHSISQNLKDLSSIPQTSQCVMRGLEAHLLAGLDQFVLEFKYALPGTQASIQLLGVTRLGHVIVRSCR